MAGITMGTALEIFTNPQDLAFAVSKKGLGIFRGPGHNGKPLITGEKKFGSLKEAANEIGDILKKIVIPAASGMLGDSKSTVGSIVNPKNLPLQEANVLTEEMVDKIVAKLAKEGEAYSYQLD